MDPLKRLALTGSALLLAACATPAPVEESKPVLRFAEPVLPISTPPASQPLPGSAPESLPPGYHCHWLSPGKKYCHGGMD